jgi:hypothetical protein
LADKVFEQAPGIFSEPVPFWDGIGGDCGMGCENLVLQLKGRQKSTPKFRFCKSLVVILSIIHNYRMCAVIRVMQQAGQNVRTVTSSQGGYGYGNPHDKDRRGRTRQG